MSKSELVEIKKLLQSDKNEGSDHLLSDLGIGRYIKKADRIKKVLKVGSILDWGAGMGQMSYLLNNRGLKVTSFDVVKVKSPIFERMGNNVMIASDPVNLPFPDASFDAVLSCGVLEHVKDPAGSLHEIRRVLKKDGLFFVFMLPNRLSYIEFISDLIGRGDHPVKYSMRSIRRSLEVAGFKMLEKGYAGFFPYNLKGLPMLVKNVYHSFGYLIEIMDNLFSSLPGLRALSTNIEIVSCKE